MAIDPIFSSEDLQLLEQYHWQFDKPALQCIAISRPKGLPIIYE